MNPKSLRVLQGVQVIATLPPVPKWHAGSRAPEVRMEDKARTQSEDKYASARSSQEPSHLTQSHEQGTAAKRRRCSADTEIISIRVARWQQQTLPATVPQRQRGSLGVRVGYRDG